MTDQPQTLHALLFAGDKPGLERAVIGDRCKTFDCALASIHPISDAGRLVLGRVELDREPVDALAYRARHTVEITPSPCITGGVLPVPSAYQIANNFDAHRKGLPDEYQDWAAEIARDLRLLAASQVAPEAVKQFLTTAPAGMVLVPREPTEQMMVAGFESRPDEYFSPPEEWEVYQSMSGCRQAAHKARLCYAAMLAAAPAAQVAEPANHAACCAEGGASVASCDCVKPEHVRIPSPAFEEWFGSIWAGSDNIPVPEWQSVGWNEYIAQRGLALGAWEAATRCAAPAVVVDEAMAQAASMREALSNYVRVIANAGGGDKQIFMASIREADDKARAALGWEGGGNG